MAVDSGEVEVNRKPRITRLIDDTRACRPTLKGTCIAVDRKPVLVYVAQVL